LSDSLKRFLRRNPFDLAFADISKSTFQFRDDRFIDQLIVFFVDNEQKGFRRGRPARLPVNGGLPP
jgi:hypothetical protein